MMQPAAGVLVLNHNVVERGTYFRARQVARLFAGEGRPVTFATTGYSRLRRRSRQAPDGVLEHEFGQWNPLYHPDGGWGPVNLVQRFWHLRASRPLDIIYSFSHKPVDQFPARWLKGPDTIHLTDWCDWWSVDGGILDPRRARPPLPPALKGWRRPITLSIDRADSRMELEAARRADGVTIIASTMLEQTRRLGIPDDRVLHLRSAADTTTFGVLEPESCRHELGLPGGGTWLGYIAHYSPDDALLDAAMEIVWKERPETRLLIAGGAFWPQGSAIQRALDAGRARWVGRRAYRDMPVVLGACDVMLVPITPTPLNLYRWPNKICDHLAAGRTQVTCAVGDVGDFFRRYAVGPCSEPNPDSFARAILETVDSPALRQRAGAEARRVAEREFTWERRHDELREFLVHLRERRGRS